MDEIINNEVLLNDDKRDRKLICNDTSSNYFVGAGAGSGKTTSLVQRMVNLIINGCNGKIAKVSEICTITFTKVAANEFKERFQVKLAEALEDKNNEFNYTEEQKERIKEAIRDLDFAFMGTIDSFCEKLIKEHPIEAKVPASSKLYDDEYLQTKYLNFYNKFRFLDNDDPLKQLFNYFQKYNGRNAKEIFKKTIPVLCQNRDGKPIYKKINQYDVDLQFAKEKEIITKLIDLDESFYKKGNYEKAQDFYKKFARALKGNWGDDLSKIIGIIKNMTSPDKKLVFFKFVNNPSDVIDSSSLYFGESPNDKTTVYVLNDKLINDLYNYVFNISIEFLDSTKEYIISELRKTGEFNFCDNLYYVKEMLKNDAQEESKHSLIRNIQKRFKYFFLDEFQDTDPMQIQIFFYLSAEIIKPKWSECIPFDGSLFIVGDEKQSIYKFKGADIRSYENVKNIFRNLESINKGKILSLSCNFRSRNSLINYFNDTFKIMFDGDRSISAEQCEFPLIPKVKQIDEEVGENKILEGAKYFTCSKTLPDVQQLPLLIDHLKRDYKILRFSKDEKKFKVSSICNSDFMILVRKGNMPYYEKELKKYGIGSVIVGKIEFNSCSLLKTIRSILYYFGNSDSGYYHNTLYELLSSDLYGLSLSELKNYQNSKEKDKFETIKNIFEELQNIKQKYSYSPSLFIKKLLELKSLILNVDLDNLNIIYYVINLITDNEKSGQITSLLDAYNYITKICENSNDSNLNHNLALIDKEDKVLIANIHQVKGDEREIVIVADNDRGRPELDKIYNDYLNDEIYIFKTILSPAKKVTLLLNNQNPDLNDFNNMLEDFEFDRQLYVAATRAKSCFILAVPEDKNIAGKLYNDSFMECIDDVICGDSPTIEPKEFNIDNYEQALAKEDTESKKESYKIINPSKEVHKSKVGTNVSIINDVLYEKDYTDYSKSVWGENANLIGTVTHRFMELLANSRLNGDSDSLISNILDEYEICVNEEDLTKCLGYIYETEKEKNDIFKIVKNAKTILTEVPFSYKDNKDSNVINTGYMDLVYEDENGWHIIDYKTNANCDDLDDKYKEQLEIYKKAFKLINGIDADAKTYHIDVNSFKGVIHDN